MIILQEHTMLNDDKNAFIYHPAYADSTKTFLILDMIHLTKNTRNSPQNKKKFMFPPFQFDLFCDAVDTPERFILWCIFHEAYERDGKLQGH